MTLQGLTFFSDTMLLLTLLQLVASFCLLCCIVDVLSLGEPFRPINQANNDTLLANALNVMFRQPEAEHASPPASPQQPHSPIPHHTAIPPAAAAAYNDQPDRNEGEQHEWTTSDTAVHQDRPPFARLSSWDAKSAQSNLPALLDQHVQEKKVSKRRMNAEQNKENKRAVWAHNKHAAYLASVYPCLILPSSSVCCQCVLSLFRPADVTNIASKSQLFKNLSFCRN